jgi:hypothetical protein
MAVTSALGGFVKRKSEQEGIEVKASASSMITITGMSEAGSTLCFNLVRALASTTNASILIYDPPEMHEIAPPAGGQDAAPHLNEPRHFMLCKQHLFPPAAALNSSNPECQTFKASHNVKIIRIRRDLRDAVASRIRKAKLQRYTLDTLEEYCDRNILWHDSSAHIADYDWVYEEYKESPIIVMRKLQSILGLSCPDEMLGALVHQSENLKNFWDPANASLPEEIKRTPTQDFEITTKMVEGQVTNNGIIGAYKDFFSEEEIAFMNSTYGDWLRKYGYMK